MKKAETPYRCHLFVCSNVRPDNPEKPGCGAKGGGGFKEKLKAAVAVRGWKGRVRVSTTGCMGLCGEGPNILLHPQGIHWSGVTEDDLDTVLEEVGKILQPG